MADGTDKQVLQLPQGKPSSILGSARQVSSFTHATTAMLDLLT